jgi:hypothetical protein
VTYFLKGRQEEPLQPVPEQMAPQSMGAGLLASFKLAQLRDGSNFGQSRRIRSEIETRALAAAERMDRDRLEEEVAKRGLYSEGLLIEEAIRANPKVAAMVVHLARDEARQNPDSWADVSLTDEDIYRTVQKRVQDERDELEAILGASPTGPVMEVLAGMAGATFDVKNLPFLLLGGGPGSFLAVASREAAINMMAETAFLPDRFEMAEVLDEADPNVFQTLAGAAAIGAGFGVAVEGLRRTAGFIMRRDGLDGTLTAPEVLAVDRVQEALESGNPLQEAFQIARQEALILRNPINPERPPLVPPEAPRAPDTAETGVAEVDPQQIEAAIAEADSALLSDFPILRYQHPLAQQIKSIGGIQWTRLNPNTGERELTWAASELMSRGVTQKQALSYIRRDGSASLDNITPSQIGMEPGTGVRMSDDGLYLDRDDLVDALAREITGGGKTPFSVEMQMRMNDLSAMQRSDPSALDDWRAPPESADEFVINRDTYLFDEAEDVATARIAEDVTDYLKRTGDWERLTEAERAEIIAESQRNGGSVEYLVERAYERETDFWARADDAADDIPWEDAARRGPADDASRAAEPDARGAEPVPAEAGGAGARAGGDAGPSGAPDGQARIPGTERVDTGQAQRDRATIAARQQQSRIGRLDQTRVEDDAGGLFGGAQRSMFDDPASPEARVVHDAVTDDIQTRIEQDGDFMVITGEGEKPRPASAVLRELDDDAEFVDIIDLCGRPRTGA